LFGVASRVYGIVRIANIRTVRASFVGGPKIENSQEVYAAVMLAFPLHFCGFFY
jgi:hypothetical protein